MALFSHACCLKDAFIKKARKFFSLCCFLFYLIFGAFIWLISGEMGSRPNKKEREVYRKLPYYRDGIFQGSEPIQFDANQVREGSATLARFFGSSRFAPNHPLPIQILSRDSFDMRPSQAFKMYWLGHASAIIEMGGVRIGIDLLFDNAAPIPMMTPRFDRSPLTREELPPLDYVIITHNHYDHLEKKTVQAIKDAHFLVPAGLKRTLRNWGIKKNRITEQNWGDCLRVGDLCITAETGLHHSNRCSLDKNTSSWNSYVFEAGGERIFWSGDTGYANHFNELRKKYGCFNLAILEIDGWSPSCPNAHLFPDEVVRAAWDLNAAAILPVHWAVYDLAFHPWQKSIQMVHDIAQDEGMPLYTPLMGEVFTLATASEAPESRWWHQEKLLAQHDTIRIQDASWMRELGAIAELDLKSLPLLAPLFL